MEEIKCSVMKQIEGGFGVMDELLELLKSKPLPMEELKTKTPLSEDKTKAIMDFLQKHGFIEIKGDQVEITNQGLEFLER